MDTDELEMDSDELEMNIDELEMDSDELDMYSDGSETDVDDLLNRLFSISYELIDDNNKKGGDYSTHKITELSDEVLDTLGLTKNCTSCKDKKKQIDLDEFYRSTN